ncbi:MAG: hypothetical protein ABIH28_00775, partial [archaeon]
SFFSSEITDATTCVEMSVSDISPSSIGIGEEFTIGVQIENCGSKIPEFVTLELLNPPEDITIKEPLLISISSLYYGNSERFIIYHMRTNDDASPGTHVLKTRLSYGERTSFIIKNSDISFEVIGEKAEIGIASIKTLPVLPYAKDTVELTLRIENVGEGDAKSIRVYTNHPFQGIKQAFLGKLASDEDGPAVFTFIADKSGEFDFPVTISYYDDFGEKEFKSNVDLTILEKKTNVGGIIFAITLIILLGVGIFYFFKVKKSKDKIIHQLLKGNTQKEKDKK